MASANVELVRSLFAEWGRGDFGSFEWAHPDIEFVVADGLAPGRSRGQADMIDRWRGFLSAWTDMRVEAEEFRELDDERVLVLVQNRGRGKASGLDFRELRARGAQLFHVRGGRVARLVVYYDRERALADLGLASGAAAPPSAEDNLAAVRAMFDEFTRRESGFTFRIYDEEVTLDSRELPLPEMRRVFHGHDGVREFWRGWLAAWGRIDFVDGPHHRANGNQVATWWRSRLLGKGSGVELPQDSAMVFTFQNGRVVHLAFFLSRDEALRAAGLEP